MRGGVLFMALRTPKTCKFPYCQKPESIDRGTGMCEEHTSRWLRSPAFLDAAKNENVRAYCHLGLQKQALRELAKLRRRWAKAEAAREEEGA